VLGRMPPTVALANIWLLAPLVQPLMTARMPPAATLANFWLLTPLLPSGEPDTSPGDLNLCQAVLDASKRSDSEALQDCLSDLNHRPVCVEFSTSAEPERKAFRLPTGDVVTICELSFGSGGLGGTTWDAGVALAIWLSLDPACAAFPHDTYRDRRVLELGSGCGIGGIAAALGGGASSIVLSDIGLASPTSLSVDEELREEKSAALRANLRAVAALNGLEGAADVVPLDWRDCLHDDFRPDEQFALVTGSDLIYYEADAEPLAAAVVAHTKVGGACHMMSRKGRPGLERLLALLREAGALEVQELGITNNWGSTPLVLSTFRPH